jgi:para-aminobenzoate synthetase component 2
MHGKTSEIRHDRAHDLRRPARALHGDRYHSLVVVRDTLPDCLEVSAWTDDGTIMALRHRQLPLEGVQFHPESILTATGKALLRNFLGQEGA